VLVAGRVEGSLVVINGDLLFDTGAEVTGDVIVVGGTVNDTATAGIGGEVRQYREPLLYRLRREGDELVYAPNLRRRLFNPGAHVSWGDADSRSSLTIATGGTFNRIEGLPVVFGPLFDWKLQQNFRMRVDALGVFRSAGDLSDKRSDLGYMFRGELRSGDVRPVGLGVRGFDVVSPVEDWGLHDAEIGWSAFVFGRDYRDYFLNKGWAVRTFAQAGAADRPVARAPPRVADERRQPGSWTVSAIPRNGVPNPPIDEGHFTTIAAGAVLDTRNDPEEPTAGWLVRTTLEDSRSSDVVPHAGVPATVRDSIPNPSSYSLRPHVFRYPALRPHQSLGSPPAQRRPPAGRSRDRGT